jgi:uncharacterized NAD(P)/FAD-binding protein YdhS
MKPQLTIGIIGGGFSGISLAAQLAIAAKSSVKVLVFNIEYPVARGVAYQHIALEHLLNVPAQSMSFYADKPLDFIKWLDVHYPADFLSNENSHHNAFVPRAIFGQYVSDSFNKLLLNSSINYMLIEQSVSDINILPNKFNIITSVGEIFTCDKIVLATGNQEPEHPAFLNVSTADPFFFNNPWKPNAWKNLNKQDNIVMIGSGLTMADLVLSILKTGFEGKFIVVSHKAHLPMPFMVDEPVASFAVEIKPDISLAEVFRLVKTKIKEAVANNLSPGSVISGLRPYTQQLWSGFSTEEKRRFIRHLRPLWMVNRHRLPLEIFTIIKHLIEQKRILLFKGKINAIVANENGAEVHIHQNPSGEIVSYHAQRIINCTGPQSRLQNTKSPLLKKLEEEKIICNDRFELGLKTTPEGRVCLHDGGIRANMFAMGSLLKGTLWETTAVPEIRKQAELLAMHLLAP